MRGPTARGVRNSSGCAAYVGPMSPALLPTGPTQQNHVKFWSMMAKYPQYRFIRRDSSRAVAGVAAAAATAIGFPIIVSRILFVVAAFLGFGIPLYILLWFVSPRLRPDGEVVPASNRIWALGIILLMPILFALGVEGFGLPPLDSVLLASGFSVGCLMVRRARQVVPTYLPGSEPTLSLRPGHAEAVGTELDEAEPSVPPRTVDGPGEYPATKLGGVCAWISHRTGLNVIAVRAIVVAACLFPPTFPWMPFLYGFAIFFVPRPDRLPAHVR